MKNTQNESLMEERSNLRSLRCSLQPDGKAKLSISSGSTDDDEEHMPDCCLVSWDEHGMWTGFPLTEDD